MVAHIYNPKILFMMDEEGPEFRSLCQNLTEDGITIFLASTPEEGIENLSLINIDALIYKGDFTENPEVLNFLKTNAKKFPVILVGDLKKNDIPTEWLNVADTYLNMSSAQKELAPACFQLIEQKRAFKKVA